MKITKQKVERIDFMGSDLSVVNAARVSFAKESEWEFKDIEVPEMIRPHMFIKQVRTISEKDQKLIAYLAKHGHWTPFAHAFLSFRIKAPIFVARQLVKHQVGLAWNEVSRRYVDDEPEFYFPEVWRGKPVNAKQGSSDEVISELMVPDADGKLVPIGIEWAATFNTKTALMLYNHMIENGVAPEQARMVLPLNTMTEWIWSGSLMAFARVCKLRLDPHAQQETQEIAKMINEQVPKEFEHSWKALVTT